MANNFTFVAVEQGAVERIELAPGARVSDLVMQLAGRLGAGELHVFKEDEEEPLGPGHKLDAGEAVLHVSRCRFVQVTVNYNTAVYERKFAPGTTIGRLTRWAAKEAGLGKDDAGEHVLQIAGTREQPPQNAHLGSLAVAACAIAFDLVPKQLVQG